MWTSLSSFSDFHTWFYITVKSKLSQVKRAILMMKDAFLFDTFSVNTYIHTYCGVFVGFFIIHILLYAEERVAAFDSSDAVFLRAFGEGDANRSRDVAEFVYCFREDASNGEIFSGDFFR